MINIEEIRQNNHIKYADHAYWAPFIKGSIVKVDFDIYRDIDQDPHLFDPILLTTELLVDKCGFTFVESWTDAEHDGLVTVLDIGYLRLASGLMSNSVAIIDKKGIVASRSVIFLHELQNLYFSLTGKELEINNL